MDWDTVLSICAARFGASTSCMIRYPTVRVHHSPIIASDKGPHSRGASEPEASQHTVNDVVHVLLEAVGSVEVPRNVVSTNTTYHTLERAHADVDVDGCIRLHIWGTIQKINPAPLASLPQSSLPACYIQ